MQQFATQEHLITLIVIAAAALWTSDRRLVEVTWFWALAGSLQALLAPDTGSWPLPSYAFLQYYIVHATIVAAALFLVAGLRVKPAPGAVRRVFIALCPWVDRHAVDHTWRRYTQSSGSPRRAVSSGWGFGSERAGNRLGWQQHV